MRDAEQKEAGEQLWIENMLHRGKRPGGGRVSPSQYLYENGSNVSNCNVTKGVHWCVACLANVLCVLHGGGK